MNLKQGGNKLFSLNKLLTHSTVSILEILEREKGAMFTIE
jgi:hypothetical protein